MNVILKRDVMMGMFDDFVGNCIGCGSGFIIQTKLYQCCLVKYKIGDRVITGPGDVRLRLKDKYQTCHSSIVVVIENKQVIRFQKEGENMIEGLCGAIEMPLDIREPI